MELDRIGPHLSSASFCTLEQSTIKGVHEKGQQSKYTYQYYGAYIPSKHIGDRS